MYSQVNYSQTFGKDNLSITTDGSILVACSNLLERFGETIDPVALSQYVAEFTATDASVWDIPHSYDGKIVASAIHTEPVPEGVHAIVRFNINQKDHYCLVSSVDGGYVSIIDSVDGTLKTPDQYVSLYGHYVDWCSYTVAELVTAPPPPPPMIYIENTVDGIAYKSLGTPKKLYVVNRSGTQLIDFGGAIQTYRDFIGVPNTQLKYGAEVRIMGTAHHPVIPTGKDFYITLDDWGEFTRTGRVAQLHGYTVNDLSDTLPTPYQPAKPAPVKASIVDVVSKPHTGSTTARVAIAQLDIATMKLTPERMGFVWFNEAHTPVHYQVMHRCIVRDYMRRGVSAELTKGKTIAAYGTFRADGRILLLLKVSESSMFDYWYGAPEVDLDGNRVLEEVTVSLPDSGVTTVSERQALHRLTLRDHATLTFAILERRFNKMKKRNNKHA